MKKHGFLIVFLFMFIGILLFQYNESYRFRIKPPSEEWSKEVLISRVEGAVKTYPKILKFGDKGYLMAYQNGENIKAEFIDKLGEKKSEVVIPVGEEFIRCLNLLSDGQTIYINWITTSNSIKTMYSVKMDSSLKVIEQNKERDVQESSQIGDDTLILTYNDKIVIRNIISNRSIEKSITSPGLVAGVNTNQGTLITYHENGRYFKYFFVKDGVASDINLAVTLAPDSKGGFFDRVQLGTDNKYAYLMVEAKSAFDRYGTIKCITFSLDGKEEKIADFKVGPNRRLFGAVAISSGDEARFIASSTRAYERNETQEDIIDFSIKNGEVIKYTFATRTNQTSMYPAGVDNTIFFLNYLDTDKYDIYMTSMDEEFKAVHNVPMASERNKAISDTLLGFIYSVFFVFLIGFKWILFGLTAICVVSFIIHSVGVNPKKILYIISYVILLIIKTITIYGFKDSVVFPDVINSPAAVISLCVIISLICLTFGYRKYIKDMDAIPLWSFAQAMFIDTLLTQMIFIPYIY